MLPLSRYVLNNQPNKKPRMRGFLFEQIKLGLTDYG